MTAADAAAEALGVRIGMPAAKAQALVAGLVIRDADPAGDAAALERLALWILQRVAPIVAADHPDGIVIDSAGADHLHGGEVAMLDGLVGRLAMSGVAARRHRRHLGRRSRPCPLYREAYLRRANGPQFLRHRILAC
ncbi:hypothetical protein MesoLjLc_18400 [Mesorhizobium sp. L-8-10]|nr:hypothetical protein MesoLjLc_18400 [Mesorhizobium sp. L-8-10]